MKKFIFIALTMFAMLPAAQADCNFTIRADDDLKAVVDEQGGWPVGEKACALLNSKNLELVVDNYATVLDGVSVASVHVTLGDKNLNIRSSSYYFATSVNAKQASMTVANDLLYNAVKIAVGKLDFDKAAREIDGYRAKASTKPGGKR